jgi:hypothetical protein
MTTETTLEQEKALAELARELNGDPYALVQLMLGLAKKTTLNRIIRCAEYPVAVPTPDLQARLQLMVKCVSEDKYNVARVFSTLYMKCIREDERKKRGQYFTPEAIAERIPSGLELRAGETILEAGMGTGILALSLLKHSKKIANHIKYIGVEIDPILALASAVSLDFVGAPPSWFVMYANFLTLDRTYLAKINFSDISAIISNPPFVRFHTIKGKKAIINRIAQRTGLHLSGLSGLHSFFLAQSASLLGSAGRMIFIFPVGIESVNHGARLLGELRSELHYSHTKSTYGDLAVFHFTRYGAKPIEKTKTTQDSFGNFVQLNSFAAVHRGISTGFNSFFVLNDDTVKNFQIRKQFLLKVVPPRIPLRGSVFKLEDWERYRELGRPCWLLHIPSADNEELPSGLRQYLADGVRRGVNLVPTCRLRDNWYSVELVDPPHFIFTYMHRWNEKRGQQPRFLYNEAKAFILTNLLGVYLKDTHSTNKMTEIAELLTRSVIDWIQKAGAGRLYSGGLRKLEPKELGGLPVRRTIVSIMSASSIESFLPRTTSYSG